ncbi:MAG: hypothetical protein ACP5VS_13250 [Desulfomonilaceae bacterium]
MTFENTMPTNGALLNHEPREFLRENDFLTVIGYVVADIILTVAPYLSAVTNGVEDFFHILSLRLEKGFRNESALN